MLRDTIKGTSVLGQCNGCPLIVKQKGTDYVDCRTHLIATQTHTHTHTHTHTNTHVLVLFLLKRIECQNLGLCDSRTRAILLASVNKEDKLSVQLITFSKLCAHFFISVINQLDAQNFCFTISLFHASTCFEHMCSSSG